MRISARIETARAARCEERTDWNPRASRRRSFVAAWIACAGLSIASCALAGNSGNTAQGKATFQERCSVCHGADASGHTPVAQALGTIPDYRSKAVQDLTDAQIRTVITEGKGKMPAAKGLSQTEIANLIAFIRSLAKK